MTCMKCGRVIGEDQVFCNDCLAEMEKEPIRIETPVVIPTQPLKSANLHRRPVINPEEELKRMQKFNQNLILVLVLLVTLVILLGIMLYDKQFWAAMEGLGQNYSVIETFAHKIGR